MREWKDLPFEVLATIFGDLEDLSDVIECQHTCKKWILAAQERLYRRVLILDVNKIEFFTDTIVATDAGRFVKAIKLFVFKEYRLQSMMIGILATHCPNIESITGIHIKNVWKDIAKYHDWGYFKRLKEIKFTLDASEYHDYMETMIHLRKNMTKLVLKNTISNVDLRTEYKILLQNLHEFPKLSVLVAEIQTTANIFALESIGSCSTTLKEVKFTAIPPTKKVKPNPVLDRDLKLVIPRPSLKILSVEGVYLKPNIIEYLMYKFPQLDSLNFNEFDDSFSSGGTLFELPMIGRGVTMHKFFIYLSRMKSFTVRGKLEEEELIKMIDIYRFGLLKEDTITVHFCSERTIDDHFLPCIELKRESSKENQPQLIRITKPNHLPTYTVLKVRQGRHDAMRLTPQEMFVLKSGAMIKELKMEAKVAPFIIKDILSCCISLKALTIANMNLSYRQMSYLFPGDLQNSTIEVLTLDNCDWAMKNAFCNWLAHALPSLQYLEFNHCMWMVYASDVLGHHEINMPGIRFEQVKINKSCDIVPDDVSHAFLQINDDQFYLLGCDNVCRPYAKEEYQALCEEKTYERFHIICESLKTFILLYPKGKMKFVNEIQ
ncbi:uncharacterized protein EV154DRAFT_548973 [Mucor mucedo]|uniref:uncharacterized protein n=1 Tax=Mucor mucedo TaxID=29922 RepID=UPI0022202058|nr:uncharacterized protein EV154DRAFT_548973 [Mucor mucedo]KAI7894558.1 hypothetical protein EV154DRAFT_548973 [Mucor mucedo]